MKLLIFLAIFVISVTAQCSTYLDCGSCTQNPSCGWCNSTCVNGTDYGSLTGVCEYGKCWSYESCPTNCSMYTTCTDCLNTESCGWCGKTHQCFFDLNNNDKPCSGICGQSSSTGDCWKSSVGQCPTSTCDSISNCTACTDAGCYWCGKNKLCMESTYSSSPKPCGYNNESCGTASTADCWKGYSSQCPSTNNCEGMTNCTSCTDAGCYWCGKNRMCMEASYSSSPRPCGYNNESCGSASTADCWKGYTSQCPNVSNCALLTDCMSCTSQNCYWCGKNRKCMEASYSSQPTPCGYNNDSCGSASTADCWKGYTSQCPTISNCESQTNCYDCTSNNCAWCGLNKMCMEPSYSSQPKPCGYNNETCGSASTADCWKSFTSQCPTSATNSTEPVDCSQYDGDCAECVLQNNCGYCTDTKKCLEASYSSSTTPCGTNCSVWNYGTCDAQCKTYQNCSSCNQDDEKICGWCAGGTNYANKLVSQCVQANSLHTAPISGYTCARWHNTTNSCPNCAQAVNSCEQCIQISSECGWCNNTKGGYKGGCMEGNFTGSFFSNICESVGGNWTVTCGYNVSCPIYDGVMCGANGYCNWTSNECICNAGYVGPACSCNNDVTCWHGTCNATSGICQCNSNYYGPNCNSYCDPDFTCSGHGNCLPSGLCNCSAGFFGGACNVECNPQTNCSGHGTCINPGICFCNGPYIGKNCSNYDCTLLSDTCGDCLQYSDICSWCEDQNTCLSTKTACNKTLTSCEKSCTSLRSDECVNGEHCDCALCTSGCYYYNGVGTPNACFSGWSWRCGVVKGLGGGAIAGIVIACLAAVGAGVGGFLWWRKRKHHAYEPIRN